MQAELGWSRAAVTGAFSLALVVSALGARHAGGDPGGRDRAAARGGAAPSARGPGAGGGRRGGRRTGRGRRARPLGLDARRAARRVVLVAGAGVLARHARLDRPERP